MLDIHHRAHQRLRELKSEEGVSEGRVERLEEFANRLKTDSQFAGEVYQNLMKDPSVYDDLLDLSSLLETT
jgi:hypothetical protein